MEKIQLSQSQEDYLEEIYLEVLQHGYANVTAISNALNVKKASVTGALNQLSEKKLINYSPDSKITITADGEKIAKEILKKHDTITKFFTEILCLSEKESAANACRMEHIVSDELFLRLTKFAKFISDYSASNPDFKSSIEKSINSK